MGFYLFGCKSRVALPWLNISAVFIVLLLNVRLNLSKTAGRSGKNKLIFAAMVSVSNAKKNRNHQLNGSIRFTDMVTETRLVCIPPTHTQIIPGRGD